MEQTPPPLSKDDLQKINARIRELTAKLKEVNDQQDERYGQDRQMTPDEMMWNKELRQLRRQRDNNERMPDIPTSY